MKDSSDDFVIFPNINQNCNFRIIVNIVLRIEEDWKQMRNVIVTFSFIGSSSVSVSFFQTGYFRNHICNTFSAVFDASRRFTGGNFLNSHPNVQMHSSYIHIYILQFHSHRFHKYHGSHSNQYYT